MSEELNRIQETINEASNDNCECCQWTTLNPLTSSQWITLTAVGKHSEIKLSVRLADMRITVINKPTIKSNCQFSESWPMRKFHDPRDAEGMSMSDCEPLTMDEVTDWFYKGRKVSDVDLAATIKILYDRNAALQSEVERLREDNRRCADACLEWHFALENVEAVEAERDALKAELEGLSGKTGFCLLCEGHAKEAEMQKAQSAFRLQAWESCAREVDRLRKALERCVGWMEPFLNNFDSLNFSEAAESRKFILDYAKQALSASKDAPEKPVLYSGQCDHHIRFSDPCKECKR